MAEGGRPPLPTRSVLHESGLFFAVRPLEPAEMTDAFLHNTVQRIPAQKVVVQVPEDRLGIIAPGHAPAGIVYNVSRSGSTLLAQMLKEHANVVVYSEPQALNEIIMPPHTWARARLVKALRSLGEAFGRHAQGPYVIKLSSWSALFCDLIDEAFPDAPWIFTYRDPVEVGVSLFQRIPGWFDTTQEPSFHLARVVDPTGASRTTEEYIGRVYGALCGQLARLGRARGKLVPYATLPSAVWQTVAPHFGLSVTDDERQRMTDVAQSYSKAREGKQTPFEGDSAEKQAAASPELRAAIERFAWPELRRLEAVHGVLQ